ARVLERRPARRADAVSRHEDKLRAGQLVAIPLPHGSEASSPQGRVDRLVVDQLAKNGDVLRTIELIHHAQGILNSKAHPQHFRSNNSHRGLRIRRSNMLCSAKYRYVKKDLRLASP